MTNNYYHSVCRKLRLLWNLARIRLSLLIAYKRFSVDSNFAKRFGDNLTAYLAMKGWNDIDLARKIGVDRSTVGRWLSGEFTPKDGKIYDLIRSIIGLEDVSDLFCKPQDRPHLSRDEVEKEVDTFLKSRGFLPPKRWKRTKPEKK